MESQDGGGVAGGSEAISAAANAASAFNNFASTIEAIMGKLTGEIPGAEGTPGEPGKPPVTLQSQIDDLTEKNTALVTLYIAKFNGTESERKLTETPQRPTIIQWVIRHVSDPHSAPGAAQRSQIRRK